MRFLLAFFLAVLFASGPVAADDPVGVRNIRIIHPWARASAGPMQNGVTFLEIRNTGSEPDRLNGIGSPAAAMVQIHESFMEAGLMKMRMVDRLEIPGGESVILKPHGLHIMLMKLKAPLKQGETLPLTLHFEKSGSVDIAAPIASAGASSPPD